LIAYAIVCQHILHKFDKKYNTESF